MQFDIYRKHDIIHLRPNGKLIGKAAAELRREIHRFLPHSQETPKLIIDFENVPSVDSSSLGALMEVHLSITKEGGRIAVININKHINSLIVRSRLISTFEHFESEEEAVSALQQPVRRTTP